MTLRRRVALAAAAAILLAVAGLGIAVEVMLERTLRDPVDRTLRSRAADVARLSATAPALVTQAGTLEATLGGDPVYVEVLDRRGRIVARSLRLGGRVLPVGALAGRAIQEGRDAYADGDLGGEPVRLYAAPLAEAGGGPAAGGAVVVATPTERIDDTLGRLRTVVAVAAVVAALAGAAAATALTGRALRPLRRLSAAAGEIEATGDPSQRLPAPGATGEVSDLADTLNQMLAGLERARERERRFVSDASHELRTPLTALRGNAAHAVRHGADPSVLADIAAAAERLSRLVDDLLALAREDAAARPSDDPVPLHELAREAGRAPDVRVDAPAPLSVRGDRAALERALANLVENARRHGPPGGTITVSARRDGDAAELAVQDEGPGPSPGEAEHVFSRFGRGSGAGGPGAGLGLAIVRATAERHGGSAGVTGSRFSIRLPLLRDPSEDGDRTAPTTANDPEDLP